MTDGQETLSAGFSGDGQSGVCNLRELIAKLSDGVLTFEEASRLNLLLKDDPIAQELYLDHMLIDGLLEFEIGAVAAARSPSILPVPGERESGEATTKVGRWPLSLHTLRTLVLLSAVLSTGVLAGGWLSRFADPPDPATSTRRPIEFVDPGFEQSEPLPTSVAVVGKWIGDLAEVVGPQNGITPFEGERMLRFVKSVFEPDHACDLYQLVDLTPMSKAIATGRCSVDASAFFNAIPHDMDDGYAFGVTLFACVLHSSQQQHEWPLKGMRQLSVSGQQIPADRVADSWQLVRTHLTLPADTTHLLVQVSALRLSSSPAESHFEVGGHFVDNLEVALVTRD